MLEEPISYKNIRHALQINIIVAAELMEAASDILLLLLLLLVSASRGLFNYRLVGIGRRRSRRSDNRLEKNVKSGP